MYNFTTASTELAYLLETHVFFTFGEVVWFMAENAAPALPEANIDIAVRHTQSHYGFSWT